jgi:magnesium transporter
MLLDLRFSIFTLGLGAGTFIAALYGMNLKNYMEEADIGFWGVSAISAVFSTAVLVYGLGRLRKVQRVSMWGECPPANSMWSSRLALKERKMKEWAQSKEERSNWGLGKGTTAAGLGALGGPAEIRAERLKRLHDIRAEAHAMKQPWLAHVHALKRRKAESRKGDDVVRSTSSSSSSDRFGNTVSGLNAKPGDGSPTLE